MEEVTLWLAAEVPNEKPGFSVVPKLNALEVEETSLLMPKLNACLSPVEESAAAAVAPPLGPHATHSVSPALLRTKQLSHSHDPGAGLNILAKEFGLGLSSFFAVSFGTVAGTGMPKLN